MLYQIENILNVVRNCKFCSEWWKKENVQLLSQANFTIILSKLNPLENFTSISWPVTKHRKNITYNIERHNKT